jgi:microcin C transport system substrate-binding protein
VDAVINAMVTARTRAQMLPACHALDRIVAHEHYLIGQWYAPTHRMAYNAWRLARPRQVPPYAPGETWVIDTWWARPAQR